MDSTNVGHHFSVLNIPFGIASSRCHEQPQAVTRLGDTVVFLHDLQKAGLFQSVFQLPSGIFINNVLNSFSALPKSVHRAVRHIIQQCFRKQGLDGFPQASKELVSSVTMRMPVEVRDFIDFSCSIDHVRNAGRIMAKATEPPPAFFKFPIGYQGRTSSIVVSGSDIERPVGQFRDVEASSSTEAETPGIIFGPSRRVDYEVELAIVIGKPLPMRQRLRAAEADEHIFGFVLLNDWSARDIQAFEMAPLGPFNGKSLGTTISPWVVTLDALEPFRVSQLSQNTDVPIHLQDSSTRSAFAITLHVDIIARNISTRVATCKAQNLFWSPCQIIAHSVASGSALRSGDLLATGTISGPDEGSEGCLLETTSGGEVAVQLSDGSQRTFLQDDDIVQITGFAGEPLSGVGFGECFGRLVPCRDMQVCGDVYI